MKSDGERGGEPRRIADLLASLMASRGYGRLQGVQKLQDAWPRAITLAVSVGTVQSRPGNCQRGVLEVIVANSVVMQELNFQKGAIIRRLQELVPEQQVRDLRFRLGQID